jgi:hypothetical protein
MEFDAFIGRPRAKIGGFSDRPREASRGADFRGAARMAGVFSGGEQGAARRSARLVGVWPLGGGNPADDFFAGRASAMTYHRARDGSIDSIRG